jgi:type I restriction enzyme S subunit
MSEHQWAPLEEWMESIIDYRGKTPEKTTAGIPLITAKVIKGGRIETPSEFIAADAYDEWMRRGIPEAGDVVITTEAPLGEVAQLPKGKVALAQRVITLRGKKNLVDNTFLKYLLLSRPFQEDLEARATGTTVMGIKQSILRKIDLAFPSFLHQKAIAHILGTLDDKIELNRKTNETLEAMAKALFKSWFVDFDPVKAKAEGRSTGLPAEISDLFSDSFEDSELGETPCGWETGRLDEILEIDPPRQLKRGSVSPYLEMKGVPTSGHSAVDVVGREFSSGSKFRNGDTLLARITPCLENGKTAFVDFLKDGEIGWGSTEFIVMCGRREEVNPFAYYLARSEVFRNNAIQNMVGSSGRQRVPSDAVSGFTLPLPPKEILVKFGLLATYLMRRISATADQSVILSKIRDALLLKLISGEIRIPDAEKMLEEVGV